MKRWLIGVALCCVTIAAILLWRGSEAAPGAVSAEVPTPEPVAAATPPPIVPPEPVAPSAEREAEPVATNPPPEATAPAKGIPRPEEWTEETLFGTTWKGESFDFSFAKDGTWYMAGRPTSKWRVEGGRVKLFDDKGEVHYLDIDGDELLFNGKPIGYPVSRE